MQGWNSAGGMAGSTDTRGGGSFPLQPFICFPSPPKKIAYGEEIFEACFPAAGKFLWGHLHILRFSSDIYKTWRGNYCMLEVLCCSFPMEMYSAL